LPIRSACLDRHAFLQDGWVGTYRLKYQVRTSGCNSATLPPPSGYELEPVTVLETPTIEPDTFIVGFALADGIMFEFDVDTVDSDANTVTGSFTHEHQFDGTTYATTATLVLPLEKVAITQVNPASWHQELRPC